MKKMIFVLLALLLLAACSTAVQQETQPQSTVVVEQKAVEVGNIFSLGTKFSEPFDLKYKNEKGEEKLVIMGSYGIGLSRLMGTIVEALSDDKGIIWPETIAPFQVHLLALGDSEKVKKEA